MEEPLARLGIGARGKLTGDLPTQGALDERDVAIALRRLAGKPRRSGVPAGLAGRAGARVRRHLADDSYREREEASRHRTVKRSSTRSLMWNGFDAWICRAIDTAR